MWMTEEEIIILNEYVVYVFIGSYKKMYPTLLINKWVLQLTWEVPGVPAGTAEGNCAYSPHHGITRLNNKQHCERGITRAVQLF